MTGDRNTTHKHCIMGEQIGDLKYSNCFVRFFIVSCLTMPCRRHRASFHQVSGFDPGRKVAYRDCGLSFKIGQRVGQNQATLMRISRCWMQEEAMDRRGRLHPPRCTNGHDNRRIVCMTVMDHAATS
ncbi:transposable element Tc3 transposase [Trichonephila clavipes]|nr:transposable element Tc3 transposase [Trichonephila clavipes]